MQRLVLPALVAGLAWAADDAVTIESNVPVAPAGWAVLERKLIDVMSEAAVEYTRRYVRSGGTLIWRTTGGASLDDLPESFYNFPLLYALGGDERLRELSFRQWNATLRQLTFDFGVLHKEFPKHGDWFHIGEGWLYFYFLALVDPTDHETVARARRYAGFYLNEDPEAPNYDARVKIIRSPHNGSLGPRFGQPEEAAPYGWSKGMASYGLPLSDLPGIRGMEDLKDPENARRMGRAMAQRMYRGDVPGNLAATSLALNAWMLTGQEKYAAWAREYIDAWMERTRANGGITPDNMGLSGKIGEDHGGKWWGGLYGWSWPHGYYNLGMAFQLAAANGMLASGGDMRYLEIARSNLDRLIAEGKTYRGAFLIPTKRNDVGWFSFKPVDRSFLASLWSLSLDPPDWRRIERVRQASAVDWHVATRSPYPNNGYAMEPEKLEDCYNCDIEGLADWTAVANVRNKEDRGHEGPWLRYLAGANPGYPEQILSVSLGHVAYKMNQIRNNVLLLEYDPRGTERIDPKDADLTQVHEHHWQTVNPVTTEALVQLMLGAPQIVYNGGLLHAPLRYFDPARRRPGLPRDVAALVRKVERERVVAELVNLSPFEGRDVTVQAGTFGEHTFTTVKYPRRTDKDPIQPDFENRPAPKLIEASAAVNAKFFTVHLPAGTGLTVEMGVRRFVNKPSYAFPWHGSRVPVR